MNYVLFTLFVLLSVKHFIQFLGKTFCSVIYYLQLRITQGKQQIWNIRTQMRKKVIHMRQKCMQYFISNMPEKLIHYLVV